MTENNEHIKKSSKISYAKPFLKWAGGKGQLIHEIDSRLPDKIRRSKKIKSYIEPFVGGGAVFFHLKANYDIEKSILIDNNKELIIGYIVIKNDPEKIIEGLLELENTYLSLPKENREEFYYKYRNLYNEQMSDFNYNNYNDLWIERAIQLIFLNKTCFNGLFRQNKLGEFNVPFGQYENPKICNTDNILKVNKELIDTIIICDDYSILENFLEKGSFIYFDPPYRPLSPTSNFTDYSKETFDDDEQIRLSEFFIELDQKGVYLMLSNSDPKNSNSKDDFFDDLYKDFKIDRIKAKRMISSNGKARGDISELLIRNYKLSTVKESEQIRDLYLSTFNVTSLNNVLNIFTETLIETNRTYEFFVDWKKIQNNYRKHKIELNLLNSLVGSKEFNNDLVNILKRYPEILPVIPSLLAIRELNFPIIDDFFKSRNELINYNFNSRKLSSKEIESFVSFFEKTGLKKFFTEIAQKSIPDYFIGVEVGMDTNARKNRSGNVMEKIIEYQLDLINKKSGYPFPILKQKKFSFLEKKFNFKVNSDIRNRKADFIYLKDFNKPINIEVNFYSGSGSKPQEIVDAYIQRQSELEKNNIKFIWITDGGGWKEQQNQIRKGFEKIDYLMNLHFVNEGLLEEIIKSI